MQAVINGNRIAGLFSGSSTGISLPDGVTPENYTYWRLNKGQWEYSIEYGKEDLYREIKEWAKERLAEVEWRVERAKEREQIGAAGETLNDLFSEREAIRRASNRAEAELAALADEKAIEDFVWEVLPQDYPPATTLTRLTFMRRFTDAERANIRAARDSGQSQDLLDFWELLQLASHVNLNDPDIQSGVAMLEANGLIAEGRAAEILDA
jgi:hypothetical protein